MASMASELLKNLAQALTPPPPPPLDDEYDGLEYSWKYFVFRPAYFKNEVFFLAAVIFYIAFFWVGSKINLSKAKTWLNAHMDILEKQFSRPTAGDLTADGYSDFFNFSTGRRNVASLHTLAYQIVYGLVDLLYSPKDNVTLDFKLHPTVAVPDFVWGLVVKDEAKSIKNDRWDLTFTKTSESAQLPPNIVIMSEYADVTENVLKIAGPVLEALKNPKIQPYFRSLSITDQPRVRPSVTPSNKEKHVTLSLVVPPPSRIAAPRRLSPLCSVNLRPETKSKLKKTREDFAKTLKDEAERDAREEAAEAKLAAKRRAEEERIANLSAAEQQKLLDRDRKRNLRKTQGKVVRK
ncbi:hypothetical protein BGW80DRAFT_1435637 [Lactifluus volemus]|nr:hypothetical protein BGW80DRAFT_1435637 [Lactifluus volemus]